MFKCVHITVLLLIFCWLALLSVVTVRNSQPLVFWDFEESQEEVREFFRGFSSHFCISRYVADVS